MHPILLTAKELQLELSSKGRRLYFHGESMRPFLVEGDEVIVEPIAFEKLRAGDIVTYRFNDKFPTRRVVRKRDAKLVLWCENWPARRYFCAREDVLGLAVARGRNGAWITRESQEWQTARRRAMRAWHRIAVMTLPRRVVRKFARMASRAPA